jgi:hypothetical protein
VERLRDGKSYATRSVKGSQDGKLVFVLLASYSTGSVEGSVMGETPFGFIPTLKDIATGKPNLARPAFSHSLRFAVESSGKAASKAKTLEREDGGGITSVPGFVPRWQIDLVPDVMDWDQSVELEEDRWTRFLENKGGKYTGKARRAVEEYIQVGFDIEDFILRGRIGAKTISYCNR